ncbi:hypothetical protein [uncultured Winogradskyella sp.]|uniref:hypothetical protein n=1 Tax=uncultured Winogradskyella sp. TaxID=395353 RepID=UPI0030D6E735|tara:strand:+ start:9965 stop:10327 length:363 start_codon:yes stop_codon:yes gene_type:complete
MKTIFIILALLFINTSNAQFISEDDAKHFVVGAVLSGTTYSLIYGKTKNKSKAFWYSIGVSALAGLSKEIYDGYIISGRFDTGELVSTITGGLIVSYTFSIFTGEKKKQKKKELAYINKL